MRMLVIGKPESHTAERLLEEGTKAGCSIDVATIKDLRFEVRRDLRSVFIGDTDILEAYDTLFLLGFYPYFSEALMLAEWAHGRGLRVIDQSLAEDNFVKSKTYDNWKLAEAGLPVPDSVQVMDMKNASGSFEGLKWPAVAKGVHGSGGQFVFKVDTIKEAKNQLKGGMIGIFVFQEFVEIDEEYRIIIIGGKAAGAVRKSGVRDEFRRNFALGASLEKAELTPEFIRLSEEASKTLKCEIAGVDLAIADGKPYILEVNSRPQFEGFEAATGINVAKQFIEYVIKDRDHRTAERRKVHAVLGADQKGC